MEKERSIRVRNFLEHTARHQCLQGHPERVDEVPDIDGGIPRCSMVPLRGLLGSVYRSNNKLYIALRILSRSICHHELG